MTYALIHDTDRIRSTNRRLGLEFGLLAGLAYTLIAWGTDSASLAGASSAMPGFKIIVGGIASLLIAGAAGLLTASLDSTIAGIFAWFAAGVSIAWITAHLPYDLLSTSIGLLDSRFEGLEPYPLLSGAGGRLRILIFIVGALFALSGALQLILQDSARGASTRLGRWFILVLGVPFFVLAAFTGDLLVNRPIREPIVAVDRLIRFAIEVQGESVDPALAQEMRLGALGSIERLIASPRELRLGEYQTLDVSSSEVEVNFDGTWVRCVVVNRQPVFCSSTEEIYRRGLTCLVDNEEGCAIAAAPLGDEWLAVHSEHLGDESEIFIEDQYGFAHLLGVHSGDGNRFHCQFMGKVFEGCEPAEAH